MGPANRSKLTSTDLDWALGRELMTRHPNDVHTDREHQCGSADDGDFDHVLTHLSHQVDHVARQGRDGDIDQKPDRHVIGLEVDTNHRSNFKKDK